MQGAPFGAGGNSNSSYGDGESWDSGSEVSAGARTTPRRMRPRPLLAASTNTDFCLPQSAATQTAINPGTWRPLTPGSLPLVPRTLSPRRGNTLALAPWHARPLSSLLCFAPALPYQGENLSEDVYYPYN